MQRETKYNIHVEWASFALNSFAQPEAGRSIEQLIPGAAAAAAFIPARGQSKRVLYWL